MYNKNNLDKMFHDKPLDIPEAMEQKDKGIRRDKYLIRISQLYNSTKERGIKPMTSLQKLTPVKNENSTTS